ncbi:complex I subunit 4 family protein [Arthrobacter sp. H16F315]|uniref:complex I subunit 4 family protein n=1 Tax=Arthrobacter sp. H16F315 TaxID=2955314 RepID=UPI0020979152|nr:NADH-quinone oxidoreductase subunit M [Arthrobacter sp. H16F315]MDD1475432.1 NADH-quinone oxidoreductase subunit M [Arthrobacter sp. H16F315]
MLSLVILLPLAAAALILALPQAKRAARLVFVLVAALEVVLAAVLWAGYRDPGSGGLAYEEQLRWIPNVGSSYHVGVDGLSLPLITLTAVIFLACAIYDWTATDRPRPRAALFLFLEATSVGLFAAQDLILFFLFFDLSIVGMYFIIAGWGHGDRGRSALKFFLYTFLGSLALLLGFIGLYLGAEPHTFDIPQLLRAGALRNNPAGVWVLGAIIVGLAVKTPTVPFHTWLPPAHTDAPATGSAVLAGVLLKMGTYGFVRIAMPLLPDAWRAWAPVLITVGVVSVLYGALVALAQSDLKRMIAYTSVNHMGYIVLALGAAGAAGGGAAAARETAVTGAVTQMVSHGLITGALFLLAGVLHNRAGTYGMGAFGGLAGPAPRFAAFFAVGAFASLGLPGFSGFIAEFQIFAGSIGTVPLTAIALPGILLTAALFLRALQRVFTGGIKGKSAGFADLRPAEAWSAGGLLVLSVLLGLFPVPLLDVIGPAAAALVHGLGG